MKPKLLQTSKKMLSRSFDPAKCKTSLRLAGSRLKLLRNKKEVQVKQMKKEIAQLLESGQDQSARVRVEHVIREEKMMAAYDLLEIYCELLVARLPIIESQKNCPIDLKEAIASLIFASPRCGDVPELLDVRKQFTAKYGKDFTTAAIELRPQCGVGRMLVEKLSAMAPDVQIKLKILSSIAEEHNVNWDRESFEKNDPLPPSDLLSGPGTFVKEETKLYVEPPHFEAVDSQAHQSNSKIHSAALNTLQQNPRTSAVGVEKITSAQTSGGSITCQPEAGPLGDERAQLFHVDSNTSSMGWNMEFKDATSAAQAAAESAERASVAAKAAAELSSQSRIISQYSAESQGPDSNVLKDGRPETHSNPKFLPDQASAEAVCKSSSEHTGSKTEQIDRINTNDTKTTTKFKDNHGGPEGYSLPGSSKSEASIDDETLGRFVPVVDHCTQKNSLEEVSGAEMSMKKQSFKREAEFANDWLEKAENFHGERTGKQHEVSSSRSDSSISDDVNIFANLEDLKFGNEAGENPFVVIDKGDTHEEGSFQKSFHECAAVVYDKLYSDIDDHGLDSGPTFDELDSKFHMPSIDQNSPEHLSRNTDSWAHRHSSTKFVNSTSPHLFTRDSSPDFSGNLTSREDAELDNFSRATFDDSDGPTSNIDEDMNTGYHAIEDSRDLLGKFIESRQSEDGSEQSVGSPFMDKGYSEFNINQLSLSSDDELKSGGGDRERTKVKKFDTDSLGNVRLGKTSAELLDLEPEESLIESNDTVGEPSSESGTQLNFGKLTGGLRHKGHNSLLFLKNQVDVSASIKKKAEKITTTTTRPTTAPAVEHPERSTLLYSKRRTPDIHSESDTVSSEDEESLQQSSSREVKEAKMKSWFGTSNSSFDSDKSDLDEDPPKESLARKSHLRSGMSRRTKAQPSSSGKKSYSKIQLSSEEHDYDAGMDGKPSTSYNSETQRNFESQRRDSHEWENNEQPTSAKVASMPAKSIFWGPPEQHDPVKANSSMMQEPKIGLRSEAHATDAHLGKKPSNSSPDTEQEFESLRKNSSQLGNSEQPIFEELASKSGSDASKTMDESCSQKSSSDKDDTPKRASHVHPKLPDYDTLLQSLRKNRS